MPYTTLTDLTDRYGQTQLVGLTDRADVATDAIDTDVIDSAIEGADALIDGYLGARYALPLSAVPPLVSDLALVIAYYKLHLFDPPEKVRTDYKDALATLKDISSGAVRLDVAGVEPAGSGSSGVTITDRERPLTEANLKGFI